MNIFSNTSSWCKSNWSMHWWNLMRCCAGLSSSLSLNMGRKYPHYDIWGTECGKPRIAKKLRGANLQARTTTNAFNIWNFGFSIGFFIHGVTGWMICNQILMFFLVHHQEISLLFVVPWGI
jgi:hypothetical protein